MIPIHVTMATKTSYHQRFYKIGIFNEKGIFKANYLLPARQNMNNFKHILHNIHLQYKHKIIVFKIPEYSYHGNRNCQKRFYSVTKKYYQNRILPKEKCEIDTIQTGFCDTTSFDNINYQVCLETHISCVQHFGEK